MPIYKNQETGTWYVICWFTDWKGERKQKCKRGFPTKKTATEWERQFLMQKQANIDMTLESFVKLYEQDVKPKLKQNTWLTKENIIQKKILPYLGKRKLSEISARDIISWQNEMRELTDSNGKPLSITYLKTIHNQMSAIFNHAIKFYGLQVNPAAKAGSMGEKEAQEMDFCIILGAPIGKSPHFSGSRAGKKSQIQEDFYENRTYQEAKGHRAIL